MIPLTTISRTIRTITALVGASLFLPSWVQAAAPVSVKVYAQHIGSRVVYNYRVVNNGTESISSVWIGHDNKNDRDNYNNVWELIELPSGWDFYAGIPASSATSPPGWRAYVIVQEETVGHAVAWETIDDNSPELPPNQTLTGMSVALDKADDRYRTAHALVKFSGQYPITVPIEPDDTSPPTLSLTVSPTRLQTLPGRLVTVKVTISVKDDYDPVPEVKLESITANEPLATNDVSGATLGTDDRQFRLRDVRVPLGTAGRVYTVTYSATDASGNKATASATVSVK